MSFSSKLRIQSWGQTLRNKNSLGWGCGNKARWVAAGRDRRDGEKEVGVGGAWTKSCRQELGTGACRGRCGRQVEGYVEIRL